ncbi:leucine-rich repeat-containing protein 46 [Corvus kubaryi]|uniref:leucine-rich repeat-containing protein 46 n=1 Tax=Corvus kubaryi TaxID=68294 RepID=UPI001C0443A9|nr:leucine-rich repeat-containing protein 46 [Corvus kubaryi]
MSPFLARFGFTGQAAGRVPFRLAELSPAPSGVRRRFPVPRGDGVKEIGSVPQPYRRLISASAGARGRKSSPCSPSGPSEELPRSLQILDLTGNECSRQVGYRDLVVAALPRLLQLDSQPIHGNTAEKEAGGGSSSSDEEELLPELRTPFTVDRDFFVDLHWELAGRARRRRRKTLEEHRERLQELSERRALLLGPGQSHRHPQVKPGTRLSPLPASRGSQRAPGGIQLPANALEKETRAKGAAMPNIP